MQSADKIIKTDKWLFIIFIVLFLIDKSQLNYKISARIKNDLIFNRINYVFVIAAPDLAGISNSN